MLQVFVLLVLKIFFIGVTKTKGWVMLVQSHS